MPTLKYFDPTDGQYKKIGVPVGQPYAGDGGVDAGPYEGGARDAAVDASDASDAGPG